jgi:hypothetical protein
MAEKRIIKWILICVAVAIAIAYMYLIWTGEASAAVFSDTVQILKSPAFSSADLSLEIIMNQEVKTEYSEKRAPALHGRRFPIFL